MFDLKPPSVERQTAPEFRDLCAGRQTLNRTLLAWLATNPNAQDVVEEIAGTIGALCGLAALAGYTNTRWRGMISGTLRLDPAVAPPWRYVGTIDLPSGRYCSLRARIAEDASGKFFELHGALEPGMTAAELEAVLTQIETDRAEVARREIDASDELPF